MDDTTKESIEFILNFLLMGDCGMKYVGPGQKFEYGGDWFGGNPILIPQLNEIKSEFEKRDCDQAVLFNKIDEFKKMWPSVEFDWKNFQIQLETRLRHRSTPYYCSNADIKHVRSKYIETIMRFLPDQYESEIVSIVKSAFQAA